MNTKSKITGAVVFVALLSGLSLSVASDIDRKLAERGRYLVATSACNDCHTPGYPESGGTVPEAQWLTGNAVGFQGPWGTTYPANLRLVASKMTEEQWMTQAREPKRPPMPWFVLRDMTDKDLRAIYMYLRSLEPVGNAAPDFVPPGKKVNTPYIEFFPKNLPATAQLFQNR